MTVPKHANSLDAVIAVRLPHQQLPGSFSLRFRTSFTGQTTAELVYSSADGTKLFMGLKTWECAPHGKILKTDVTLAEGAAREPWEAVGGMPPWRVRVVAAQQVHPMPQAYLRFHPAPLQTRSLEIPSDHLRVHMPSGLRCRSSLDSPLPLTAYLRWSDSWHASAGCDRNGPPNLG